jgi:hypothetical protein
MTSGARAQLVNDQAAAIEGPDQAAANALDEILADNSLLMKSTSFRTTTAARAITCPDSCETPLFSPKAIDVTCMVAVRDPCILYIQVEARVAVLQAGNAGTFRFLVDGKAPTPGPTDGTGVVGWADSIPPLISQGPFKEARSFAVVAKVTGGKHSVEVDMGCVRKTNVIPKQCSAFSGFATLKVAAYAP